MHKSFQYISEEWQYKSMLFNFLASNWDKVFYSPKTASLNTIALKWYFWSRDIKCSLGKWRFLSKYLGNHITSQGVRQYDFSQSEISYLIFKVVFHYLAILRVRPYQGMLVNIIDRAYGIADITRKSNYQVIHSLRNSKVDLVETFWYNPHMCPLDKINLLSTPS